MVSGRRGIGLGFLVLSLVACGQGTSPKETSPSAGSDSAPAPAAAEVPTAGNAGNKVRLSGDDLPNPDLSQMDPAVRLQLSDAREVALGHLEAGAKGPNLGAELGDLAMLYHAYDLLPAAEQAYGLARRLEPQSVQWSYYAGAVAQRLGRLDEAIELFENAWRLAGSASDSDRSEEIRTSIAWRLGRVLRQANQGDPAKAWLERAEPNAQQCPAALFELGQLALSEDRPEEAVRFLERALEIQSDALQVLFPLGQALRRAGRTDEAQVYLRRSAEREQSIGGRARCVDPLDARLGERTTGAAALITRGQHARFAGDLDAAIEEFKRAVELAPDDPIAHQALARGWAEKGDLAAAVEHFRRASQLDPESPTLANDLAILLAQSGRASEAADVLHGVLARHPTFFPSWLALANTQLVQGASAEALRSIDQALSLEPGHPKARGRRAQILMALGRREEAATEMALLLKEHPPEDPNERIRMAGALVQLGDTQTAASLLAAMVDDVSIPAPSRARAHLGLAGLDLQRGNVDGARSRLSSALELDPSLQPAREMMRRLSDPGR